MPICENSTSSLIDYGGEVARSTLDVDQRPAFAELPVEYALLGTDAVSGQFVEPRGTDTLVSRRMAQKEAPPYPFVPGKGARFYLIAALSFLAISP